IKKLVQKVVTRDTLNYRKLTDKPRSKEESANKDGDNREAAKLKEKLPLKEYDLGANLEELAFGNKRLLPVFHNEPPTPLKRMQMQCSEAKESSEKPIAE
ncbi:hypothetical protein J437_LFUL007219, partial [Ladona fulva]